MVEGKGKSESIASQNVQDVTPSLQLITGFGNRVTVVKSEINYSGMSIYVIDG